MTLNIPMIKPVLHYYDIAKGVVAFSTTRHGGVSKGQLATLNINPHRGDEPSAAAGKHRQTRRRSLTSAGTQQRPR